MVDLTTVTIKKLFEQQIRALTQDTIISKEDTFYFQLSGGWLRSNLRNILWIYLKDTILKNLVCG